MLTTGLQQIIFAPEERIQVRHQPRVLILKTFKNIPHLVERRKVRSLKMKICHRFTTHAQHKNTKLNRVCCTTGGFIVYAQRRIMLHLIATCRSWSSTTDRWQEGPHRKLEGGSQGCSRKHYRKLYEDFIFFGSMEVYRSFAVGVKQFL